MASQVSYYIYRARKKGYRIDTYQRTIFVHRDDSIISCKTVLGLIDKFGFSVQFLDSELSDLPDQKFYISLPINSINPLTGVTHDIKSQAAQALRVQRYLLHIGCRVFNPFRNGVDSDAALSEHMRADYRGLCDCSAIVFLPGWQYSNGCKHEFLMASDLRLKMYTIDTSFQNLKLLPL